MVEFHRAITKGFNALAHDAYCRPLTILDACALAALPWPLAELKLRNLACGFSLYVAWKSCDEAKDFILKRVL